MDVDFIIHPSPIHPSILFIVSEVGSVHRIRYHYPSITLDWIDEWVTNILDGWVYGWMDGLFHYPHNSLDRLMVRHHYLSMTLDGWMDGCSTE